MTQRFTSTQVVEQQYRFDTFMCTVNLVKAGKIIAQKMKTGDYYAFVHKVLARADVKGAMYHPKHIDSFHGFYSELFMTAALEAFINNYCAN